MDHSPPGSSVIPSSRSLTPHPTTSRPLVTTYLISFSIRFFGVLCCSIWGVCVCVFNINRFHYKWDHTIFVSVWLSSLSMIPSRSVCVVANGRISFFFYGQIVFVCLCVCIYMAAEEQLSDFLVDTRLSFFITEFSNWICSLFLTEDFGDFPGSSVAKTPHAQCRGPGFDPWSGS